MQEEQALTDAPERSRAELVRTGRALTDAIRQARSHMVHGEVGIRMIDNVRHAGKLRHSGRQSRSVAETHNPRC